MITKMKSDGAISTAGDKVKKGNKGRLELYAERTEDGVALQFKDYGNYGRERWYATFPCDDDDLQSLIDSLQKLRSGDAETTKAEEVIAAPVSDAAVEEATEELQEVIDHAVAEAVGMRIDDAIDEADEVDDEELAEHLLALDSTEDDFDYEDESYA